jgi:hypothetical protein
MNKYLKAVVTACTVVAGGSVTTFAAVIPDFTHYGFPTVVTTAKIPANASSTTTLQANGASFVIPAHFSTDPVTFEVLEGPLANFSANAPAGQTPIYDFAFKVVDNKTGQLVGQFQQPVMFTYTNSEVDAKSMYFNLSTTGTYANNPKTLSIQGHTLSHKIAGAPVGWVVTSPSQYVSGTTSPVTGLPISTWLMTGIGLLAAGGVLLGLRKRLS